MRASLLYSRQPTTNGCWCSNLVQHCWLVYMGDWVKDRQLVRIGLHSRDTGRPSMQNFHLHTCLAKLHGAARKHFTANALTDCNPSGHGISCQGRWADAWSASANPHWQQETPALRRMPFEPAHQSAQGRPQQAEQARLLLRGLMSSSSAELPSLMAADVAKQCDTYWPMPLPCRQAKCKSASSSAGGSSPFRPTQSMDNGVNGKTPEVSVCSSWPRSPCRLKQNG